jgi:D-sedoheptulose 7-phosphate isomerase
LAALDVAREKRCKTILFTGKDGGAGKDKADLALVVRADATERIQEVHITVVHIIVELLETRYSALLGMS